MNTEGRITYVNSGLCSIFGHSKECVIGHRFGEFLSQEYREEFRKKFEVFEREGNVRNMVLAVRCRSGATKIISFSVGTEYDGDGNVLCIHLLANEITDWKRIEE